MRSRALLALALTTSLLAACGGDDDVAPTTTTAAPAATTTTVERSTTTEEAVADEAATGYVVTLEDPGAEPRRELRLTAQRGDVDRLTQRQEIAVEVRAAGEVQAPPASVTEIDVDHEVIDVSDEAITVRGTYADVRVLDAPGTDPATNAQAAEVLEGFLGATAETTYTPTGAVRAADIQGLDVPGGAGPVLEQLAGSFVDAAESLSMPFPEEAVGVGARWRIETRTEIAGLPVEITTVIVLDELGEDAAAGTVEQELRFVPGDVDVFGTPATVVSGTLTGGGTIRWDLAGGVMPRSDLTTTGTTVFEIQGTPVEQTQTQHISIAAR